jgi:hypothetical protein
MADLSTGIPVHPLATAVRLLRVHLTYLPADRTDGAGILLDRIIDDLHEPNCVCLPDRPDCRCAKARAALAAIKAVSWP